MPGKGFNLDEYVDVAERISLFREKHPEGSLQSEIVESPAEGFVTVKAYAYRAPDDERPGIGLAWEPFPGRTPYTKDSELQNAETSAWGRAIVAALAADTKKIASKQEVRNRQEWPEKVGPVTDPREGGGGDDDVDPGSVDSQLAAASTGPGFIFELTEAYGTAAKALIAARKAFNVTTMHALTPEQARTLIGEAP